jgi:hypothetical protein
VIAAKVLVIAVALVVTLAGAAAMAPRGFAIALSGVVFPGLGHALLGLRKRALVFFLLLTALFFAGVFLERDFYTKFGPPIIAGPPEPTGPIRDQRDDLEGTVDKVWKVVFTYGYPFFVGFGNYCIGYKWSQVSEPWIGSVPGVLKPDEVPVTTRDIGYCFALLAGLLNLLVMMDAFDIACNRDELARRRKEKPE